MPPPYRPDDAAALQRWKIDTVTVGSDVTLLAGAARRALEEARDL
jgi:hypothetical protein